ncbi:MAG: alpha/beta fold hydrolase, partial [Butyricicoccus sp.]|nr:alpha/beta fold hydrolase [Butyricicoccus sp.]
MDIRCTQNIFQSANGSSKVSYYILTPEGVPTRGVVQIVHGMCEYFSRYTVFAKYLCQLGYVVCGHDQIGHGASASKQSELGYFAPRDGWKYLIEDVGKLREIMQKRYPELPYFLFGHSMGSMIARLYLAEHGEGLAGAVICGTVGPNPAA